MTDTADIHGIRIDLVDTAGVRATSDEVEIEGVSRARQAWLNTDLLLLVIDRSSPIEGTDRDLLHETADVARLVVGAKCNLPPAWGDVDNVPVIAVSSKTSFGLDRLREAMRTTLEAANPATAPDTAAVTNVRHAALLERARAALRPRTGGRRGAGGPVAEEFVLTDLQDARSALEEVTGKRTSDDLLRHIFSRFCIGK